MKKTIVVASLFATGLAFAGVTEITNEYAIGVLPIAYTNRSEIVLSIPWVAEGGAAQGIAVSNLVKTAGLTAGASSDGDDGDKLSWYDISKGEFQTWRLVANGTTNYWKATRNTSGSLPESATMEPVLKRGEAAILKTYVTTNTVYVIGQLGPTVAVTNTIARAKQVDAKLTPTYTLVAPPCALVTPFDLNSLSYVSDSPDETIHSKGNISHAGDMIITDTFGGLTLAYVYVQIAGKGYRWTPTYDLGCGEAIVPAGRGFWYQRVAETDLKITWDAPRYW